MIPMTRQDLKAVETARQIINKYSSRSAFGRCVSFNESGWDTDRQRSTIGSYNFGLMLKDPHDKEAQSEFINDSASFLNQMNEAFQVEGYHIGMTKDLCGSYYVGKDKNYDEGYFNTAKDEYHMMEEEAYRHYLLNKAQYQRNMKRNIQEALIITDDSMSVSERQQRLYAFQEGVGDTLSDAWEKFKAFINKIWLKFTEFLTRNLNTDKAYLDKYKEIILRRRYQVTGLSIDDNYQVGVLRIRQYNMMTPSIGDVESFPTENNDANLNIVRKKVFPAYNPGVDFTDFCKTYFLGGTGKTMELTDGLNMQELWDFCYNFNTKTLNVLNKNRGEMMKCINVFEQALKDAKAKQAANNQGGQATTGGGQAANNQGGQATTGGTGSVAGGTGGGNPYNLDANGYLSKQGGSAKKQFTNPKEIADIKELIRTNNTTELQRLLGEQYFVTSMGRILIEAVTGTTGGTTTGTGTGTQQSAVKDRSANEMDRYGSTQTVNGKNVTVGAGLAGVTDEQLRVKFQLFENAMSTVFAAMITAAQTIFKDYMTIIKKHVQSYLGNEDESEGKIPAGTATDKNLEVPYEKMELTTPAQCDTLLTTISDYKKNPEANKANIANLLAEYTKKSEVDIGNGVKSASRNFTSIDELEDFVKGRKEQLEAANKPTA